MKQEFLWFKDIANDRIVSIEFIGSEDGLTPNCTAAELVSTDNRFSISEDDAFQTAIEVPMKLTVQNSGSGTYFIGSTPIRK